MSFILALLISFSAFAHKGAHPDNPDTFNARGGIVKETESYHVEAIPSKKAAKIYFFDTKMKPIKDVSTLKAQVRVSNPQTSLNVVLEPMGDHFNAPYPREPLKRYKLVVIVTGQKDEVVTFDVDPTKLPK